MNVSFFDQNVFFQFAAVVSLYIIAGGDWGGGADPLMRALVPTLCACWLLLESWP